MKNTLLRIAATNADAEVFAELADGPTALVVGYDEPIGPARGIAGYIDDTPGTPVEIRNAVVAGALVDADYVRDLATVPPRDELLARIAGGLVGKIRELMMLLEATTRDFAGLIEARAVQLEEEGGEAPAAEESSDDAPAADEASDDAPVADASDETTDDEAVDDEAASDEASDEADEDSSEDEAAEASEESADGEEQGAE